MRKVFVFLSIVCALSFIAFWISCGILGHRYTGSGTAEVTYSSGERSIFGALVNNDAHWEVVNEFPHININAAGAKTIIQQNSGKRILVDAQVPDGREVYVGAKYNESAGELTIEVRPQNVTFANVAEEFGKVLWSDDVFKFPEGVTVTISFPQTIYESLEVKLGSGKMYVDELYAGYTSVDIGSGTFEMQRSEDYKGGAFTMHLGSGKAKVKNMRANSYSINVGSGAFDITGLSGDGMIDMGSGSGTLVLANDCEALKVDMGSGALDVYLEETGATVKTDIGTGSVNIDAYGMKTKLGMKDDDKEPVTVGNGAAKINIEMGSGSVDILEAANAPALELSIPKSESTGVASGTASSSQIAASSSSSFAESSIPMESAAISGVVIEAPPVPEVPSAPEAPDAPTAPEAPVFSVETA